MSNPQFRKSTYSDGDANCVEVALQSDAPLVRDSKDPQGPVLDFTAGSWGAFVRGLKSGEIAQV